MKDLSVLLDMRRSKNWPHKISSWKYLTVWRRVLPVCPEHRVPRVPSRGHCKSAAEAAQGLILVEAEGKCPWQVPVCSWHCKHKTKACPGMQRTLKAFLVHAIQHTAYLITCHSIQTLSTWDSTSNNNILSLLETRPLLPLAAQSRPHYFHIRDPVTHRPKFNPSIDQWWWRNQWWPVNFSPWTYNGKLKWKT